jgi:S1-C subfamily serine protease
MLRITHTAGRRAPVVERFGLPCIRIGTALGSEITFTAGVHPGVMPQHAEIRKEGGAYYLVDLGTAAGTFVNRTRIQRHELRTGDIINMGGLGGPELRVEIDAPAALSKAPADADGGVDLETAQRLVQAAIGQATARQDKAAAIIATKVHAAQRRAARHNLLLSIGVILAFSATLVAAVLVYRSQRAAAVLVTAAGIGNAPVALPSGTIPTRVYTGREIYEENKAALYVIGFLQGNKIGGLCTAFAIQSSVLATNAHCVLAVRERGGTPVVTENESNGKVRFKIVAATMHPSYRPNRASADSPDVGLLRIDGKMPKVVTIASDAELRAIGPGDDAFVLGFPGRVLDPVSPSATFLQGRIGRTTGLDEQPTSPDKAVLLQHDAVTRGGNSGSPIFNQYGHVIGVHAAHLDEEEEIQLGGQKTKVLQSSPFRVGMRIDLLDGVAAP